MTDTDARLWHPGSVSTAFLRVMLQTRWSAEAWPQVRVKSSSERYAAERDPARGVVSDARTNLTERKRHLLRYDPVFSTPRHLDAFPSWLQPNLDGQSFIKEIFDNNWARIPK